MRDEREVFIYIIYSNVSASITQLSLSEYSFSFLSIFSFLKEEGGQVQELDCLVLTKADISLDVLTLSPRLVYQEDQ